MNWYALGPYTVSSAARLDGLPVIDDPQRDADIAVRCDRREPIDDDWVTIYRFGERERAGSVGLWQDKAGSEFWLRFDFREHSADFFLSEDGRRITVSASGDVPPSYLATLIEGPVLGRALRLMGRPCLHATMVAWQGRAIGVMGPSGAGKSTFAAVMVAAGCDLLNDDLAVLDLASDELSVHPGRPRIRLWPRNAAVLPVDVAAGTPILEGVGGTSKLAIAMERSAPQRDLVPVTALYQLGQRSLDMPSYEIETLPPHGALAAVSANLYGSIRPASAARRAELQLAADITRRTPLKRLTLPDSIDYLRDHAGALRDQLFA